MNPTIKNLKLICRKKVETEPYARWVGRPISIYFTWFFVRTPISANQVTILQGIFGLIGCILFGYGQFIAGSLFLQIGYILDCSDGEVARWNNQQSKSGEYLDLIGHIIIIPLIYFGLGIGAGNIVLGILVGTGNIVLGMLAGLFSLKLEMFPSGKLEIKRRGFIQSLFRYPDSMNVITIFALFRWDFSYFLIIYATVMTLGRFRQIYRTYKEKDTQA